MSYRHLVVKQRHALNPLKTRDCCICGYASPWRMFGRDTGHPHMVVTVSRTDLTPMTQKVPMIRTIKFEDGTWEVTHKCGHVTYGVSDFDRTKAMNHTVAECLQLPASAASTGSPCEGDSAEGRPTAHEETTNG